MVVPVYRGAESIGPLQKRVDAALAGEQGGHEIIFVDDRGGDNSWEVIQALSAAHPHVRGIRLSRNFGQHAATLCGISSARGEWIVTIDEDLEQPPESLPSMLAKAEEGHLVVYGVTEQRSHAWWRNLTSEVGRSLFKFAIPTLNREYTSFRVIHRSVAAGLDRFQSPFTFIDGYISWITNHYATVVVPHDERVHGSSSYNLRKLIVHMVNIFVTFSDLPLRMATWLGLSASLGGGLWGLAILVAKLTGSLGVSGYASIMAGMTFLGGIQLLILGIFGEYLARINFKTASMPLFLVEQETRQ
ncbi:MULTISPECIES: glycosyltransferase family 2 protein [Stenotrophomonas]|uniref:Glycosyltransferase family 2 protein n=1 Tax=Stenotrophomonas lactitubi TaxID=2045214 RepID=A0AAW4GM88_9GAMM|nr:MULTISPECIES: glycosyltransferase family 2 protein [unclassified Stenotrophomonas]MBM9915593.1 glycosyltransferase family 2 protein [Stenotrophomonas lactitubi]MBM9922709.1 glycosyltransferase family 2 protein [Stenotrophomonas lactitubi]MBM9939339.1 glycosyltransferase family 2 protein [Stenotrophomonas lactitubi]